MTLDEVYDLVVSYLEKEDMLVCSDNIVEGMVEFISLESTGKVEGVDDYEDLYDIVGDYMMTRAGYREVDNLDIFNGEGSEYEE